MIIGVDTRILKGKSLDEALRVISQFFDVVEICASHIRSELTKRQLTLSELARDVRALCREFSIKILQVHAPYGDLDDSVSSPHLSFY